MKKSILSLSLLLISLVTKAQTFDNFKQFDGNYLTAFQSVDMDVDADGNKYILGYNGPRQYPIASGVPQGPITDLDPGTGTQNVSGYGWILAKYDANTNFLWSKKIFPSAQWSDQSFKLSKLKVKNDGNIFILGNSFVIGLSDSFQVEANGSIYLNDPVIGNSYFSFFLVYDTSGTCVKATNIARTFNSNNYTNLTTTDFEFDNSGNIAVCGLYHDTVQFNTTGSNTSLINTNVPQPANMYINSYTKGFGALYNTNLECINAIQLDSFFYINAITKDHNGNMVLLGRGYNAAATYKYSINLTKFNQADFSTPLWNRQAKSDVDYPQAETLPSFVKTDQNNDLIIGGWKYGSPKGLDFDPGNTGNDTLLSYRQALFIAKYTSAGNFQWVKGIKDISSDTSSSNSPNYALNAMEIAGNGDIVMAGYYFGQTTDFDPGPNLKAISSGQPFYGGQGYHFILRLNNSGNYVDMQTAYLHMYPEPNSSFLNFGYLSQAKIINGSLFTYGTAYGYANFELLPTLGGTMNNHNYSTTNYKTYATGFITKYKLCPSVSSSISGFLCNGSTYPFGSQILTAPGNYNRTVLAANGCSDSVINLSLIAVDTNVTVTNNTLTVGTTIGAQYKWINCATGETIQGATGWNYTPIAAGSYKVVVIAGDCADTSGCHNISTTSISDANTNSGIILYPNPVNDQVSIELSNNQKVDAICLTDVLGRKVTYKIINQSKTHISLDVNSLTEGVYTIKLVYNGTSSTNLKFIKK